MKRAISPEKRKELTERYLSELKDQAAEEGNAEAARKLNLYEYIDNCARSTRDERFSFLSCERLLLMRRCPIEDHGGSEILGHKYCHQRYWCMACAEDAMNRQLDCWIRLIKLSLCSPVDVMCLGMYLGPVITITWPIPDPEDRSSLKSFRKYMKQTFPAKLAALGVATGSWMMASAFDPIRNECRALYMGPSLDWSIICGSQKRKKARSTRPLVATPNRLLATTDLVLSCRGRLGEGQPSPWKPKLVRSAYLLDGEKNQVVAADKFFNLIRDGLKWVLGDLVEVFELSPERAFKLHRLFRHRRLTSTYGMVYGLSGVVGAPGALTIYVDRRKADGNITLADLDPLDLVGNIPGSQHAHKTESENEAAPGACSLCGRRKEIKFEEDYSYRFRPILIQ